MAYQSSTHKATLATTGLLFLLLCGLPSAAGADVFVTPFAGIKFAGDSRLVDLDLGAGNEKLMLGGMVGVLSDEMLGVEADIGYVSRFFERSSGMLVARSHVLTIMGNVMLAVPRRLTGYSLRPLVSAGAGLMDVNIQDRADAIPVHSKLLAINVGGGAVGPLASAAEIRFDLRWFKSVTTGGETLLRPGSAVSFWRAAVGLTIR